MRLKIKTSVSAPLESIKERFTEELFLSLNPPFPKVKLLEFGGCKKGDKVSLELNFIFFKQVWTSDIVEDHQNEKCWEFVDVGVKLPFFLSKWKHRHQVVITESGKSKIIDDITFGTGTLVTDLLMYPALLGQFLYRKPIYKRFFNKKASS